MHPEPPTQEKKRPRPLNPAIPTRARTWHVPNLFGCSFVLLAVFTLSGVSLPFQHNVQERGQQTKALAEAKQVALALRLFAEDHDGVYPQQGTPAEMQTVPADSNEAFACLFPAYCASERIFANRSSTYQYRIPDDEFDERYTGRPVKTLEPGENAFGYIMGLTSTDDATLPLVVDGTDGTGHYVTNPTKRGGVWKGRKAVVIHLDTSGELATLEGPDNARFIPVIPGVPTYNLLGPDYLKAHHARLLDPAVAPRR